MKKENALTHHEAMKLPIGTIIQECCRYTTSVYMIVTETGLNYFDYVWYKKKYSFDPVRWGVGVPVYFFDAVRFKELGLPVVDFESHKKQVVT